MHAPAMVAASWSAYLKFSKNDRCIGPASSSEASPLIFRPALGGSTNCAPAKPAISASVDSGVVPKKVGFAITRDGLVRWFGSSPPFAEDPPRDLERENDARLMV